MPDRMSCVVMAPMQRGRGRIATCLGLEFTVVNANSALRIETVEDAVSPSCSPGCLVICRELASKGNTHGASYDVRGARELELGTSGGSGKGRGEGGSGLPGALASASALTSPIWPGFRGLS